MIQVNSTIAWIDGLLVKWGLYRPDTRPLAKLQTFLALWAFVTIALMLLSGAIDLWGERGADGSLAVSILGGIAWIVFVAAFIILIGAAVAALYKWFLSRGNSIAGH